jgi:plastocyanin
MNKNIALFAIAGFLAAAPASFAADITGTVMLTGTPPAEKVLEPMKRDETCSKLHAAIPSTRFFVVGPNKELADVVVMLKGISGKSTGAAAPPVVMDQKNCLYVPQIIALQTGQKLLVKNSDPVLHNVHAMPAAGSGNKEEIQPQLSGSADLTFTFDKPENFLKFKCDVHEWMFAWVTVVDHPYFAVSDKDGKFTIKNVPPGKYTITALHRKAAPSGVDKEIEVKEGETAKVDFALEIK